MTNFKSIDEAINMLISIEENELGYLEKRSNSQLDSKTANAGHNNYTKYWRDINKWGLFSYASNWAGGPDWSWCAGLQTWCFVKAFGPKNAKKLLLHLPFISCAVMGSKAKSKLKSTAKRGDIVLFSKKGAFKHTGLVYKVDSTYVYTIEGNTSLSTGVVANGGAVAKKKYSLKTVKTAGHKFFTPDYSIVVSSATVKPAVETTNTTKPTTNTVLKMKINTKSDPLRCRQSPSSTGKVIGRFAKNEIVTVVEQTNSRFYKVKGKDAWSRKTITGYCATSYLKKI